MIREVAFGLENVGTAPTEILSRAHEALAAVGSEQLADRSVTELSAALNAFYAATLELGLADRVTSFTLSDFGRTLQPNGNGGTDHAWGGHHFMVGAACSAAGSTANIRRWRWAGRTTPIRAAHLFPPPA